MKPRTIAADPRANSFLVLGGGFSLGYPSVASTASARAACSSWPGALSRPAFRRSASRMTLTESFPIPLPLLTSQSAPAAQAPPRSSVPIRLEPPPHRYTPRQAPVARGLQHLDRPAHSTPDTRPRNRCVIPTLRPGRTCGRQSFPRPSDPLDAEWRPEFVGRVRHRARSDKRLHHLWSGNGVLASR